MKSQTRFDTDYPPADEWVRFSHPSSPTPSHHVTSPLRWMDWAMIECLRKLPTFGSQELGTTVWALAR